MIVRSLDQVTEFPLTWPDKGRAAKRIKSSFFGTTLPKSLREIKEKMRRWRAHRFRVSMFPAYRRAWHDDPGVALWWEMPVKKTPAAEPELRVIACDRYLAQECNAHAIALTLEALRAVERWGAYSLEQAVEGARPALPPPPGQEPARPWWEVLGVGPTWPFDAIEMAYRMKAEKAHPDRGGSVEDMAALNEAIASARKELTP